MDPTQHRGSSLPRNQGSKACISCARIKCKCVQKGDGSSCERCHRLNKTCVPSGPAKRRGPKRHAATSRTARLEEKLDSLVNLLRSKGGTAGVDEGGNEVDGSEDDGLDAEDDTSAQSTTFVPTPAASDTYSDEPSPSEAEECLRTFREEMIGYCPFIFIPPDMTSAHLRQTYPFFWLNIMSVSSRSIRRRISLGQRSRNWIVEKIVVRGERSLDLLYGLLTFINWVHLFPMDRYFATLVSQLAVLSIWDLELQMPPLENHPRIPHPISASMASTDPLAPTSSGKERTIEERRAVLGTFVITCLTSYACKSADGLRWSPHLDGYLAHLGQHSTVPQDRDLIAQVKMQLIVNDVRYSSWGSSNGEIPPQYADMLQSQLDAIVGVVGGNSRVLDNNPVVFGFYHFTTLIIHESTIFKQTTSSSEPDMRRYEVHQRCFKSIQAWLDMFFLKSLDACRATSCSMYAQLFYIVHFLHNLSTSNNTIWSTSAPEGIDSISVLERVIGIFEQLKTSYCLRSPDNIENQALSSGLSKLGQLRASWRNDLASKNAEDSTLQDMGAMESFPALFSAASSDFLGIHINHLFPGAPETEDVGSTPGWPPGTQIRKWW